MKQISHLLAYFIVKEIILPCAIDKFAIEKIERVIKLFDRRLAGDEPEWQEWIDAQAVPVDNSAFEVLSHASDVVVGSLFSVINENFTDEEAQVMTSAQLLKLVEQVGDAWLASDDGAPYRHLQLPA